MFSCFTISSANEMLPMIIKKFGSILKQKNKVIEIEQHINASTKMELYITLKQKLNNALTDLYALIANLENMGIIIKSIDDGLLDFPSKRFDEEVWLCWKYGESEIKFWHEKDSGFSGRKPICINDEALV